MFALAPVVTTGFPAAPAAVGATSAAASSDPTTTPLRSMAFLLRSLDDATAPNTRWTPTLRCGRRAVSPTRPDRRLRVGPLSSRDRRAVRPVSVAAAAGRECTGRDAIRRH